MNEKKILILGGGTAGSSAAYYLKQKGYTVTLVEKLGKKVGGLSRTNRYSGHPYEFGPHVWFWPGGPKDPINKTIVDLTDNELLYINRRLFSYIEKDGKKYRYPVHFEDIKNMPDNAVIMEQLSTVRDKNNKLIADKLPTIGKCTFKEYFATAIGNNLYNKFMADYTWKMWNIPGDVLQTSMVWADRFRHAYSKDKDDDGEKINPYDPLKFEDHTLGKGIKFQIYPKNGWDKVFDKMTEGVEIIKDSVITIKDEKTDNAYILMNSGNKYYFNKYYAVISTLDMDTIWGKNELPYTGRIMIPFLVPDLEEAFSNGAESIHYSSAEFQTRVTEMKKITEYESPDTLILLEVPILPGADRYFPQNTIEYAKKNNLFCDKAYPQQSKEAFEKYDELRAKTSTIKNIYFCGRHAEFKYWGMPETVKSAYDLVKSKF